MEIRSSNNFVALLNTKPGDKIFLTKSSAPDILLGTNGLIASVMGIHMITHRTIQSNEDYYEEREAQAARVQLQLAGVGRVRRVSSFKVGELLELEVDQVGYCDAR